MLAFAIIIETLDIDRLCCGIGPCPAESHILLGEHAWILPFCLQDSPACVECWFNHARFVCTGKKIW